MHFKAVKDIYEQTRFSNLSRQNTLKRSILLYLHKQEKEMSGSWCIGFNVDLMY